MTLRTNQSFSENTGQPALLEASKKKENLEGNTVKKKKENEIGP